MRVFCAAAVCSVLSLTPAPARADLVTFQFDGVLTSVPLELAGDFAIGDAFSYTLGLDTTTMFGSEYVSSWRDFGGTVGDYAFSGIGGGRFWALLAFPDRITGELHDYSPWLISGGNVGAVGQFAPLARIQHVALRARYARARHQRRVDQFPTSATLELLFGYRPDPVGSPLLWANGPTLTLTASSISMALGRTHQRPGTVDARAHGSRDRRLQPPTHLVWSWTSDRTRPRTTSTRA